jgi:hypothetical protein
MGGLRLLRLEAFTVQLVDGTNSPALPPSGGDRTFVALNFSGPHLKAFKSIAAAAAILVVQTSNAQPVPPWGAPGPWVPPGIGQPQAPIGVGIGQPHGPRVPPMPDRQPKRPADDPIDPQPKRRRTAL